jgi:hypothetical protein
MVVQRVQALILYKVMTMNYLDSVREKGEWGRVNRGPCWYGPTVETHQTSCGLCWWDSCESEIHVRGVQLHQAQGNKGQWSNQVHKLSVARQGHFQSFLINEERFCVNSEHLAVHVWLYTWILGVRVICFWEGDQSILVISHNKNYIVDYASYATITSAVSSTTPLISLPESGCTILIFWPG